MPQMHPQSWIFLMIFLVFMLYLFINFFYTFKLFMTISKQKTKTINNFFSIKW